MFGSLAWLLSAILLTIVTGQVFAHEEEVTELETLTVTGRADDLSGIAESSNQGRVGYGVEWANFYQVTEWLTLDLDLAFTKAEFTNVADDEIPNSVGRVITTGGAVDFPNGIFGALRLRHFGDVPLIEDGRVEAGSTTVVNLQGGYHLREDLSVQLDVFNLFDSEDFDIAYFFDSRLTGEPAEGVSDRHVHLVEPRAVRVTLNYRF